MLHSTINIPGLIMRLDRTLGPTVKEIDVRTNLNKIGGKFG